MNNHPAHMPPHVRTSKTGKVFQAGKGTAIVPVEIPKISLKDLGDQTESYAENLKKRAKSTLNKEGKSVRTMTPWGEAQYVYKIATGINEYSCAGHGGYKVSDGLIKKMPECLQKIGRKGWFEEDCDWAAVAISFPEKFTPKLLDYAVKTMKDYYPKQWETVSGEIIPEGESYAKDRMMFEETNRNNYITISAFRKDENVEVTMKRESDGDIIYVTMPVDEYKDRQQQTSKGNKVLFDPEKDQNRIVKIEVRDSVVDVQNDREFFVYKRANPEKFFMDRSRLQQWSTGEVNGLYYNAAGDEKPVKMSKIEWKRLADDESKERYALLELHD